MFIEWWFELFVYVEDIFFGLEFGNDRECLFKINLGIYEFWNKGFEKENFFY